jgi:hypothetical protein
VKHGSRGFANCGASVYRRPRRRPARRGAACAHLNIAIFDLSFYLGSPRAYHSHVRRFKWRRQESREWRTAPLERSDGTRPRYAMRWRGLAKPATNVAAATRAIPRRACNARTIGASDQSANAVDVGFQTVTPRCRRLDGCDGIFHDDMMCRLFKSQAGHPPTVHQRPRRSMVAMAMAQQEGGQLLNHRKVARLLRPDRMRKLLHKLRIRFRLTRSRSRRAIAARWRASAPAARHGRRRVGLASRRRAVRAAGRREKQTTRQRSTATGSAPPRELITRLDSRGLLRRATRPPGL